MLADSLAKAMGSQGIVFERATCARAAASSRALSPALIVLAGDAAQGRGAGMIKQLDHVPLLVISAPELGGVMPQTPPRRIGFLSPAGGVNECARRLGALIQLFIEEGLATCSMQQLADTVAPRAQSVPTAAHKPPIQNKLPATRPVTSFTTTPATQPVVNGPPPLKSAIAAAAQVTRPLAAAAPAPAKSPVQAAQPPKPVAPVAAAAAREVAPPSAASRAPETTPPVEPDVVFFSNSEVPTKPPAEHALQEAILVAPSEPSPRADGPPALPVQIVAEPAIDVSLSEPAPAAAPQAAPPKLPRTAKVTAQQHFVLAEPQPTAAAPVAASPHAAAPEPVEPQVVAAAEPAEPRKGRRVRNPLDAPAAWPAAAAARTASSSSIADSGASWETGSPKKRRATVAYVLAAVGCGALLFHWLSGGALDPAGGRTAMGALKPAAQAPETLEPVATERAPSPQPPPETPTPVMAGVQSPVARPAPSPTTRVAPAADQPASAAPTGAQALVDEGTTLLKQGRLGLAESSYQKALAATPEFPNAIVGLVRVHLARRDGAEAVRWANRLVSKQPTNATYQLLLGDAEALSGDEDAARAAWAIAAKRGNALARERLE